MVGQEEEATGASARLRINRKKGRATQSIKGLQDGFRVDGDDGRGGDDKKAEGTVQQWVQGSAP